MTIERSWRKISPEELAVISAIVSVPGAPDAPALFEELGEAVVFNETDWILDIRTPGAGPIVELPNGPLPVRAFVPNRETYRGEIIVWVNEGRLSGLEYAWVTDEPPTRWPHPSELEVVPVEERTGGDHKS